MNKRQPKITFFGGEPLGVPALGALARSSLIPALVVCNPDRPSGRGQQLVAPRIKGVAQELGIPVFQPESYNDQIALARITGEPWDLFVVVAYNFILPKWFLELPKYGVINVHPSLLPKLRGMSPIRTAILENLPDQVGVSIMLMDEKMDHGPILAQVPLSLNEWPIDGPLLDDMLGQIGGEVLATTIPSWISGSITPTEQNHAHATYTKRFLKAGAELLLDPDNLPSGEEAFAALSRIKAYSGIGDTFFIDNGKRIKIKGAVIADGSLTLTRVTPEGKKEMDFVAYLASR